MDLQVFRWQKADLAGETADDLWEAVSEFHSSSTHILKFTDNYSFYSVSLRSKCITSSVQQNCSII